MSCVPRIPKEKEYQTQLVELKAGMDGLERVNSDYYEDGCRVLELSNCLYPRYVTANDSEKAKIASLVASNFTLVDVTLIPKWRKPFNFIAEGPSRSQWLPALFRNKNFQIASKN